MYALPISILFIWLVVPQTQALIRDAPRSKQQNEHIGEVRKLVGHEGRANGVAFSPDGTKIITGGEDKTVCVWSTATGRRILRLEGHNGDVNGVAFLPTGDQVLSVSDDKTARLWDVKSAKERRRFDGSPTGLHRLSISSDGLHFLTSGSDNVTRLWEIATGRQVQTFKREKAKYIVGIAFLPDNQRILVADKEEIRVWDIGAKQSTLLRTPGDDSAALAPDGKSILIGTSMLAGYAVEVRPIPTEIAQLPGQGKSITFYRISGPSKSLEGHRRPVNAVAFSSDGRRAFSGSGYDWELVFGEGESARPDNTVRVWDLASGKELAKFEGHSRGVISLAVSSDGRYAVSTSADKTVRVWRLPE